MKSRLVLAAAILAAIVLFLAINTLARVQLTGARLDLTSDKLFTLSDGSKNVARSIAEPVRLKFYFSENAARGESAIQTYGNRVKELLQEFVRLSRHDGEPKIQLTIIDPEAFSDDEDEATAAGLVAIPKGDAGQSIFLGLIGTNAVDGREVISFFDPRRERFLEHDVAKLLYSLAHPEKKKIGLISSLPIAGGFTMDPRTQQPRQAEAWQIYNELRSAFEIRNLEPGVTTIPEDIDVLMIVHPKNLSDQTLYAIDQFALKGGRLAIFVDPLCNEDTPPGNPMQSMGADRSSNLSKLLNAWGVEVVQGKLAGDMDFALPVQAGTRQKPEQIPMLTWIGVTKNGFNQTDPATGQLATVNFGDCGIIQSLEPAKAEDATPTPASGPAATITPLVTTTTDAMQVDAAALAFMPDPKKLLTDFASGDKKLTLVARLSGKVRSAFPNGRPAPAEGETPPADSAKPLAESNDELQAVLFADVDVLSDRFWVQKTIFGVMKGADNGDLVVNVLDSLLGSKDLISIQARGVMSRPFDVVDEMARDAAKRYRDTQAQLEEKLRTTEQRLQELQRAKPQDGQAILLSPEQQEEIKKFREERSQTQKQLREVQRNLNKDVEKLGTLLKVVNIGIVPALVALAALGLGAYRVSRRKSGRHAQTKAE